MNDFLSRTELLIGDNIHKLTGASVIVFGVGGVGSYAVEALVRAGIGHIAVVDSDIYSLSNLNRQIFATLDTIGKVKVDVAVDRIKSINPDCKVDSFNIFYNQDTCDKIVLSDYDYIIDAIDTVSSKILLVKNAKSADVKIISSMGTGNKLGLDFQVADITKTSVCPLARVMRKELGKQGIKHLKVVFSEETPLSPQVQIESNGRHIPASISFVPAVAGLTLAREVIVDLISD